MDFKLRNRKINSNNLLFPANNSICHYNKCNETLFWLEKTLEEKRIFYHYFNLIPTNPDFEFLYDDSRFLNVADKFGLINCGQLKMKKFYFVQQYCNGWYTIERFCNMAAKCNIHFLQNLH